MSTVLCFILAHFLADFPFQPRKLVVYKTTHKLGVFLHSLTHLLTSIALLLPLLSNVKVQIGIVVVFVTHNLIDQFKITVNRFIKSKNTFITFTLDQLAHLLVIYVVAVYYIGNVEIPMTPLAKRYYEDPSFILYLLILTLATYFYDVTRWTYENSISKKPYSRNYAVISRNALIVTIAFVIYWVTR